MAQRRRAATPYPRGAPCLSQKAQPQYIATTSMFNKRASGGSGPLGAGRSEDKKMKIWDERGQLRKGISEWEANL